MQSLCAKINGPLLDPDHEDLVLGFNQGFPQGFPKRDQGSFLQISRPRGIHSPDHPDSSGLP